MPPRLRDEPPEAAEVRASEVYFYLPHGFGGTKLPAYVE